MNNEQNNQMANGCQSSGSVVRCNVCDTDVPILRANEIEHVVDGGNNRMVWLCFDCEYKIKKINNSI